MTLQSILSVKGSTVYTIRPDQTVGEAVRSLVEHRIGALLVCQQDATGCDQILGIITERDLLYAHAGQKSPSSPPNAAAGRCPIMDCPVAELMSRDVVTGSPGDSLEQVMGLMTMRRVRHLPVLLEGRLVGIVSIGDIVKANHDLLATENKFMKDYIRG